MNKQYFNHREMPELMCLKCFNRWTASHSEMQSQLKNVKCQCGETGYVIKTGQIYIQFKNNE
jgi:hypothetical protein